MTNLVTAGEVSDAVADVQTEVLATIPAALAIGAVVVAALVGWRVAKRFFS